MSIQRAQPLIPAPILAGAGVPGDHPHCAQGDRLGTSWSGGSAGEDNRIWDGALQLLFMVSSCATLRPEENVLVMVSAGLCRVVWVTPAVAINP